MRDFKYSLMYVTDDTIREDTLFFAILEAALKGGADIIQLREKNCDTLSFYKRAVAVKKRCAVYNTPLIINDRLDIALAINADGMHIGQNDMPYAIARALLGKDKIIGLSVSNEKQALEANLLDVNYIGISPIFATHTKTKNLSTPLGIEGLKKIKLISTKRILCIGGIAMHNAENIIQNGADGIAVISSISSAKNAEIATKKLKHIICQTGLTK
jgi:thiamine-phosphate pyrophosphorylase